MFLTMLFNKGLGYSAICTARSALSNIILIPGVTCIGGHPLVKRLIKGVYNTRPPTPRYDAIWDTSLLMQHLRSLDNSSLTFKGLVQKTVTLLTILSGQRVSTLIFFTKSLLHLTEDMAIFNIHGLLKHSRPGKSQNSIVFHAYPSDTGLCPVTLIKFYILARNKLVPPECDHFIVTHRKPHHGASVDTMARWVKQVLHDCGVDTSVFKAHSCRSASTSKAGSLGVSLEHILKAGQWSNAGTFYKFYNKDIVCNYRENVFSLSISDNL